MEKLKMRSENLVSSNIDKISKLFPNCITEAVNENGEIVKMIDFDLLKQELSSEVVEGNDERYTLNWAGKKQSILTANSPINATLRPCKEENVGKDGTNGSFDSENIYIEGDNLDVLKLLRETYLGKVKMIYIDPPYNTGNDFVYEDDFATSTEDYLQASKNYDDQGNKMFQNNDSNGRFHSDWLSMMYARLKLARDFLTEDGVIFISIDDNEQDNLKKICDEVFGEINFINNISVNMSNASGPKIQHAIMGKRYPKIKETIFLYAKNASSSLFRLKIPKYSKEKWDNEYNLIIPEMTIELREKLELCDIDECNKIIRNMHIISLQDFLKENNIENNDEWKNSNAYRICSSKPNTALLNKAKDMEFDTNLYFLDNKSGDKKLIKTDFNRNTRTARIELLFANDKNEMFYGDHWGDIVTTGGVAQEGDVPFPNGKKPLKLLKRIINTINYSDMIVMDFFSGSASTAHAVMQLNAEDGGNRKFIMVQLPEICDDKSEAFKAGYKNICEIGKERIRRAGKKIMQENQLTAPNLDIGFRVFKLDSSNMKDVYYDPSKLHQDLLSQFEDNIKEDRTPEDLLFQVMLDLGVSLSSKITEKTIFNKKVFIVGEYEDGEPNLICCFDSNLSDEVVTEIAKMKPLYAVFRDSSMAKDSVSVNFDQIFSTHSPDTTRKVL